MICELTKEFSFEMAHALEGYDGACSHIHGHSYRLFVTVEGEPCHDSTNPKYGMAMDFGVLKSIVKELIVDRLDHSFVIRTTPTNRELVEHMSNYFGNVKQVDYQPTCENMVIRFAELIGNALPKGVRLVKVRLHETATSYAEYMPDNQI